ncbi:MULTISPECIES: potassium channel family protein [Vibrio]|jgi:trk system potassium uptake protein TrkA|uniref:Potassium transporter KtrA n=5 Tax=Vibrio TaxID=662 RepID=A0A7Z1MJP6_9VIBR|nr:MULTISPECIES: TrkA family potassium uptake protein [Vibrio]KNH11261.1 potassium transporter KtrA [Vibrio lentus]MBY7660651.1 TrkA family potassium uptake protein [Vibrio atlanticus]ERM57345.1 Potassium uptake protein, integral membrane component, KtrA [Vibrio cyclitrophicus FF75]KAA8599130.1 KtrAB potassium uptake system peripheral membrane component KtrA [Vibrio cyclitrophicus]MBE8556541.1 TrkA family potassium uptake protein [Vibrio sp. OPT24]|tara:strand:+ start:142 stop:801 length:660 start_codon:yes stop_codon:yes gene_type:complete
MSDKQFAVIGLGRFGLSVCKELQDSGAQVLAVDIDEEKVKEAAAFVSQGIVANCANEETVVELRLDDYDMVMVSIGADVNSSILATLVVKEAGAKTVWVKANDKFHGKILSKIGADHIIMPERDMGIRVARKMLDKRVLEFIDLGSGLAMTEIVIGHKFLGKRLCDLSLCKETDVQVLGFKRGPNLTKAPSLDISLEIGDVVIIAGPKTLLAHKLKNLS